MGSEVLWLAPLGRSSQGVVLIFPPLCSNAESIELFLHRREPTTPRAGVGEGEVFNAAMSALRLLTETDAEMLADLTVFEYFRYIVLTVLGRGAGDRVRGVSRTTLASFRIVVKNKVEFFDMDYCVVHAIARREV